MSARDDRVRVVALRAAAEALREYADKIYTEEYSDTLLYDRDSHIKEHFAALADHLEQTAVDLNETRDCAND